MKTNKQGKIKIQKSGYKRSKFNWSHDINTTFGWGEVQPTQCKLLIPGSKTTVQNQNLIRLAPMVAPTFGRIKYKTYNQFVGLDEIYPNFDAMMAQEPVSRSLGTRIPQKIPTTTLGCLSSYAFMGARATLYFAIATNDGKSAQENAAAGNYVTWYRQAPGTGSTQNDWNVHYNNIAGLFNYTDDLFSSVTTKGAMPKVRGCRFMIGQLGQPYHAAIGGSSAGYSLYLGIPHHTAMCPIRRDYNSESGAFGTVAETYEKEVTFEGADYIIEFQYAGEYVAMAVELSDFGKRIRKGLQGCGYQINLSSQSNVSILPLFATYKAYYDIFGLTLYKNFESTYCARAINLISQQFWSDSSTSFNQRFLGANLSSIHGIGDEVVLSAFMINEFAEMWYTDEVDFVSSHINKLSVSPIFKDESFVDTGYAGAGTGLNLAYVDNGDDETGAHPAREIGVSKVTESMESITNNLTNINKAGTHLLINNVFHGELDAEMLKRLYKWTNRNTLLGRQIAELMKAQGLGKYMEECKSNFIGSTDTLITISDVVSTSDTDNGDGKGAVLGEYGGKGLQYTNDGTIVFENDRFGYWITLACVVPVGGYTQGLDGTLYANDKFRMYNPDFDAMGMELTTKEQIVGAANITGERLDDAGQYGFGFIPRYSMFKVAHNLVNGDFNRHSCRNVYLPYTLDKHMNLNDFDVKRSYIVNPQGSLIIGYNQIKRSRVAQNMPIAGNSWRYPTRYGWLGNFDRIFAKIDEKSDGIAYDNLETDAIGWNFFNNDNFLSHGICDMNCYAPMKPIEESYGLEDDEANEGGVDFVHKA